MNKKFRLVLNIIIIISSIIGLIYTIKGSAFMSTSALYYYTIQSNIWIILITIIFSFFDIFKIKIPNFLYIIKYIITVGITITFLVFSFMLIPQILINGNSTYLLNISNLTLHFISPILAIISFIFFDQLKIKKKYCYLGMIMPIYYLIFAFILANISTTNIFRDFDGSASKFPYFFLDYETNGWFTLDNGFFGLGTFYWIIIVSSIVIIISKLFLLIKSKQNKK